MSGTVTVDRESWALHQRALNLLNKMADDPKQGVAFKKMAQAVDGTLRFADLDMAERMQAPVVEKLTATEARLAALEAEREADKLARQQAEQVRSLESDMERAAKRFSLSDEGRRKMTERMQEKGSLDAEAAAAWVASQTPKAKPSDANGTFSPSALNLYGSAVKDDKFAGLHEDPIRWQEAETIRVMQEFENAGLTE